MLAPARLILACALEVFEWPGVGAILGGGVLRVLIGRPQSLSLWRRGGSLAVFRENPEWCLELAGLVFQDRLSGEVHWRIMCGNYFAERGRAEAAALVRQTIQEIGRAGKDGYRFFKGTY